MVELPRRRARPLEARGQGPGRLQGWDPITDLLGDDFTCVRVDFRGHGDSSMASDYGIELGIEEPAIVGHSIGATAAAVYAARSALHVCQPGHIRVPLLSLHGSPPPDDYEPWLTGLVPTAEVEVWEGMGHLLHLVDAPRFAARVTEFLS
jgi:pimeloyl-ACP methyl ester carboxylesterase